MRDFANASEDVVFMDALLLYIGPDKIQICIGKMRHVAKRSIILLEMHMDRVGIDGTYTRDGWLRGYRVLFKNWVAILSLFVCHPK